MADDHSLAAHTPTSAQITQVVRRRALELLGANKGFVNTIAPLPYQSDYPMSKKLIDSLITLSIDPIVKPLSLKGKLDKMPALKKIANELADRGYFQRYPGGGIGFGEGGTAGGGPGEGGSTGTGPGAGEGPAGPAGPAGDPAPEGQPPPEPDPGFTMTDRSTFDKAGQISDRAATELAQQNNLDAARGFSPTFGDVGRGMFGGGAVRGATDAITAAFAALSSLLGGASVPGFGAAVGLATGTAIAEGDRLAGKLGISRDAAMALLGQIANEPAGAPGAAAGRSGQSGGEVGVADIYPKEMTATLLPGVPVGKGGPTISAGTRANAAARVGGGISPSFLEALQSLQQAS